MHHHEGGLVLDVQIAAHLKRTHAFDAVHKQADRGQQIGKVHLAAGEDGAGRDRKLMTTGSALKLAAGADVISLDTATARANSVATGFRPAHRAERAVCGFFASLIDVLEGQGAGLSREEEVLCHVIVSSAYVLNMVTLRIVVNGNRIGYGDNRHNGGCDVGFIEVGGAG